MISSDCTVLTNIYQDHCNLAVWQRQDPLAHNTHWLRTIAPLRFTAKVDDVPGVLHQHLPDHEDKAKLSEDIWLLADMYSSLFELENIGVRLQPLERAMCPKFHCDRVPVRLITTYGGPGTEFMHQPVKQIHSGDVALLKGTAWEGNEENGVIHRSPAVANDEFRLVLTLDFVG
ncbi:DUF1826 domain-containing protein [Salinibius halmophilus]|uniref:DUF1826 domain-containing protein n=1 Tax=Salinibius halmophilus TaxID=1853216 RepID=UPI000E671155|nr:DUF1826 domain-containing protein [Salinibius halmophilus]